MILAHYLINVRKLSYEESYTIIKNWLDRCDKLENLDNYRNFEYRIKYALKNAVNKGIGPMSKEKIKTDSTYSELYQLLKKGESSFMNLLFLNNLLLQVWFLIINKLLYPLFFIIFFFFINIWFIHSIKLLYHLRICHRSFEYLVLCF